MSEDTRDLQQYVIKRYQELSAYYWRTSQHNKRAYKATRSLTIILGALVTLIASLASSNFVTEDQTVKLLFGLGTPVLAALLTIISGFSQSFQWGAAWRDMVINAQRLEKQRDIFIVARKDQKDLEQAVNLLNDLVLDETETFFQRMLGGARDRKHLSPTEQLADDDTRLRP